jgi:ribokinase
MASQQPQVVGIGQCSLDLLGRVDRYPPVDQKTELEEVLIQGGGPVATALVVLSRLGVPTAFFGRVGDDEHGRRIRLGLADEGVDCRGLRTDPGATSQFAFIAVEKGSGQRNIFWTRGSARPLAAEEIDREAIAASRVLHLDGLQLEAALTAAQIARHRGLITVLDGGTLRPGTEKLLSWIDHPVVSERFARQLCPSDPCRALERLLEYGATAATLTCGARGSHTLTRCGERFSVPAFAVAAVDTTGCGDVFHGGYIYGLLQDWPLRRVTAFAAACAALKTRALGGRTAIPTLAEVESLLAEQGDPGGSLP